MKPILVVTAGLLAVLTAGQAQAPGASAPAVATPVAGAPIAGLQPHQRPAGAPTETDQPASPEQMARWLRGVSAPHPGNVDTIAATGRWWVPLRGPGMTPPYDPRGWHEGASAVSPVAPASAASR